MTTNKTIVGVQRELLERAVSATIVARGPGSPTERDLRALLDAPAYPNRLCHIDYTAHPYICGCLKWDEEAQRRFDEHQAKAAQPQGELVAMTIQQRITWMMCFNADLYEDWLGDSIPEDELSAWLTEEGVPEGLPGSQLSKVLSYELQYANSRLAEQPAPVAAPLDYGSLDAVQRLAVCRGEQPATAAVVLPERKPEPSCMTAIDDDREASIWNACLDEVTRLNVKS